MPHGLFEDALVEWAPDYPLAWHLLARVESARVVAARAGRSAEAREALATLEAMRRDGYVPPPFVARVEAALGETSEAILELEAAVAERSFALLWLAADPDDAPLRGDPRYALSWPVSASRRGCSRRSVP